MDNMNTGNETRQYLYELLGKKAADEIALLAFVEAALDVLSEDELKRVNHRMRVTFVRLAALKIMERSKAMAESEGSAKQ